MAWQIVEAETSHHPSSLYQSRTDGGKEGREEEGEAGWDGGRKTGLISTRTPLPVRMQFEEMRFMEGDNIEIMLLPVDKSETLMCPPQRGFVSTRFLPWFSYW